MSSEQLLTPSFAEAVQKATANRCPRPPSQSSFLSPSKPSSRRAEAMQRARARRQELARQERAGSARSGQYSDAAGVAAMALVGGGLAVLASQAVWLMWLQRQVCEAAGTLVLKSVGRIARRNCRLLVPAENAPLQARDGDRPARDAELLARRS